MGQFKNGKFHGKGVIYIKGGGQYHAVWNNGKESDGHYEFADSLKYDEKNWEVPPSPRLRAVVRTPCLTACAARTRTRCGREGHCAGRWSCRVSDGVVVMRWN